MKIKDMHIIKFCWFEFFVVVISYLGSHPATRIAVRQIHQLGGGEAAHSISQDGHTYIRYTLNYAIINPRSRCQRTTRIVGNLDSTIGTFFYLLTKLVNQYGMKMRGWEEVTVSEFYHLSGGFFSTTAENGEC